MAEKIVDKRWWVANLLRYTSDLPPDAPTTIRIDCPSGYTWQGALWDLRDALEKALATYQLKKHRIGCHIVPDWSTDGCCPICHSSGDLRHTESLFVCCNLDFWLSRGTKKDHHTWEYSPTEEMRPTNRYQIFYRGELMAELRDYDKGFMAALEDMNAEMEIKNISVMDEVTI